MGNIGKKKIAAALSAVNMFIQDEKMQTLGYESQIESFYSFPKMEQTAQKSQWAVQGRLQIMAGRQIWHLK